MILQILGFAALAHLLVDFISHFNLPELPDKPFRCDMCMAAWISVIPFVIQFGWMGVLYAAMSGVVANFIYKYI